MKKLRGRLFLLFVVTVVSVILALPSFPGLFQSLPDGVKRVLSHRGLSLGLDLQGGIHLVLEVEEERAVEIAVDRIRKAVEDLLKDKAIVVEGVRREGSKMIVITLQQEAEGEKVRTLLDEAFPNFESHNPSGTRLVYELRSTEVDRIKTSAINQALETLRNRIDEFGVAEPLIQRLGLNQIAIQLPGVKDPQRAKDLIQETALLEFKLLEESKAALDLPPQVEKGQEDTVRKTLEGKIPDGAEILFETAISEPDGRAYSIPYLVKKDAVLTGDVLQDARVTIGDFNEPIVSITFDSKGAREFDELTAANIGKRMAVVLDGKVYSAPVIRDRISGGRAIIEGTFTTAEANDLAVVLRAGALPAPLKTLQDLTVGPSLGQDSIEKGLRTTIIAGTLVLIFMIVYYRLSGLIANMAVFLNLICLLGALSGLNATLTLPGIAGIILTIGMGVDSNVLIFERIREELRQGRPVRLAVDSGYNKAFLTIVDSHVTTLITGLALFLFGTGPIKGFAVTLCLGIAINLFTALVGTKVVFDFLNRRKLDSLSI
ncbi:protein translocase subunit SecD [Candidatus Nitrospira allomarina]|jgi:preprotein translocase subunit SecD|uniref:Protein translocase subunit SecD n=1 Tax=Candidatus Nitrospira allomarina TaxID=3020900 RepID=A0AA96G9Y8_9BACT|nr:protein translocase subunit SecD [Candidatus Nitrospira allomarina]WNM58179.1 protein translocase subunit SecD [Candidatus Nitrospira allomarina]